jgi:hypothetical protein
MGSFLTRFSSMLQNILESFVQTCQTKEEDGTFTHFLAERDDPFSTPARLEFGQRTLLLCTRSCVYNKHKARSTIPYCLTQKINAMPTPALPLFWAAIAGLWLVTRDCEAVNASASASPRLQLYLPSISSSGLSYKKN